MVSPKNDSRSSGTSGDESWRASWEDAEKRKLTNAVAATPAQRLAWLEEAIRLAHQTGALPKPR